MQRVQLILGTVWAAVLVAIVWAVMSSTLSTRFRRYRTRSEQAMATWKTAMELLDARARVEELEAEVDRQQKLIRKQADTIRTQEETIHQQANAVRAHEQATEHIRGEHQILLTKVQTIATELNQLGGGVKLEVVSNEAAASSR